MLPDYPPELQSIASDSPKQWFDSRIDTGHITADTGVTRWTGEKIDWALAVGHLFQ